MTVRVGTTQIRMGPRRGIEVISPSGAPAPSALSTDLLALATWKAMYIPDEETAYADGGAMGQLTDFSGNAKHALQATAAKKPTYKTAIVGGRDVARLDGTDDGFEVPAIDLSGTNAVTLFAIFTAAAGVGQMVFENSDIVDSYTDAFYLAYRHVDNTVWSALNGDFGSSRFTSTATLTTTPKIVSVIHNKGLASAEAKNWINGVSAGAQAANTDNTNNFGNRVSYIGSRAGTGLHLNGDLAFLGIIASAVSSANHNAIGNKLDDFFSTGWTDL